MKISDSTIARILEYAVENRRLQIAIAALLAVVALLLGPTYPGGVGVALNLLPGVLLVLKLLLPVFGVAVKSLRKSPNVLSSIALRASAIKLR